MAHMRGEPVKFFGNVGLDGDQRKFLRQARLVWHVARLEKPRQRALHIGPLRGLTIAERLGCAAG